MSVSPAARLTESTPNILFILHEHKWVTKWANALMCRLCLPSWEFWFSQEQSRDGTLTSIGKWTSRSRQQDSFAFAVFLLFLFLFFSRASCFTKIHINLIAKLSIRHSVCYCCYHLLFNVMIFLVHNFLVMGKLLCLCTHWDTSSQSTYSQSQPLKH